MSRQTSKRLFSSRAVKLTKFQDIAKFELSSKHKSFRLFIFLVINAFFLANSKKFVKYLVVTYEWFLGSWMWNLIVTGCQKRKRKKTEQTEMIDFRHNVSKYILSGPRH